MIVIPEKSWLPYLGYRFVFRISIKLAARSLTMSNNEYRLSVSAVKLINSHLGLFEPANAVNLSAAIAETGQLYGLDEVDFDQKYAKSNSTYDTFQLHVQRV
ncbi:MAG TPA: hypothetical protein DD407_09350 [Pseudohongiella sp.]|nr:hypothetical protein [Pseudohongiella sp.]